MQPRYWRHDEAIETLQVNIYLEEAKQPFNCFLYLKAISQEINKLKKKKKTKNLFIFVSIERKKQIWTRQSLERKSVLPHSQNLN